MAIEIQLLSVNVHIMDVQTPDGGTMRVARFEDPQSGIAVVMPMDMMTATKVGLGLTGKGLVVPEPKLPGGQALHKRWPDDDGMDGHASGGTAQ
jgi:hypothetical protein